GRATFQPGAKVAVSLRETGPAARGQGLSRSERPTLAGASRGARGLLGRARDERSGELLIENERVAQPRLEDRRQYRRLLAGRGQEHGLAGAGGGQLLQLLVAERLRHELADLLQRDVPAVAVQRHRAAHRQRAGVVGQNLRRVQPQVLEGVAGGGAWRE